MGWYQRRVHGELLERVQFSSQIHLLCLGFAKLEISTMGGTVSTTTPYVKTPCNYGINECQASYNVECEWRWENGGRCVFTGYNVGERQSLPKRVGDDWQLNSELQGLLETVDHNRWDKE